MCRRSRSIGADARATVRTDDRVVTVFLALLSVVVLVVLLHYAVVVLDTLPSVPPDVVGD
ncbi:hypothetical protein [Halorubrum halodurans]|uniref:Uncharacterized protein n=1 Tax=Halorubrum halodurans TaxID=1383851 RepID=A0A256IIW6_9EURY|nr:hypothetical protein [Halorubrum halodurans]OYR56444.1 hypothetical protein DJ70_09050 [Halorubrum halodurans]